MNFVNSKWFPNFLIVQFFVCLTLLCYVSVRSCRNAVNERILELVYHFWGHYPTYILRCVEFVPTAAGLILLTVLFISKFYGRVIFMLLFLEFFTLINLFSICYKIGVCSWPGILIYLFLRCVALEARLGLRFLVRLARNQRVRGVNI